MKEEINAAATTKTKNRIKCSNCASTYIYILAKGTVVCRACGHREEKK